MLDFLPTIAFLMNGVQEGNPLVRWALVAAPSPFLGLLLVKLAALGLGLYCWQSKKLQLLSKINLGFAVLIAWNLLSLIVKAARTLRMECGFAGSRSTFCRRRRT